MSRAIPPDPPAPGARARRLADLRVRDGVGLIELRHPPANAYTFEMMHELDEGVLTARFDGGVRVLVVHGAGERFFCGGPDLDLLRAVTPAFRDAFQLHAAETLERLARTPLPVIAALDGHAVGGGLELALAADLRVARAGPGRIAAPEDGLGVRRAARWTAGATEPRVPSEALAGRAPIGLDEARALGLVDEVWEAGSGADFLEKVLAFARRGVASGTLGKAPGLLVTRERDGGGASFETALARERERLATLVAG